MNKFIFAIRLSWLDASHLPAIGLSRSGALVPLRGGPSENGCQKAGEMTADISDNARAAYL